MSAGEPGRDVASLPDGPALEVAATTDGRVPGERGRLTRQRLLDATVELLSTTSWRSVKVTDIARQARTSPATFYQYFGNVEQAIRVLAEEMIEQAGELAQLVGGDWSEAASWETARAVTEGFLSYWEANRAVFRVVDLATEEGDAQLRGMRVRALNAVTVALAQVITPPRPHRGDARHRHLVAGRRRPDGRGRRAGGDVRQCVGPPLRLRVLGHPHGSPGRHPGADAPLGGDGPRPHRTPNPSRAKQRAHERDRFSAARPPDGTLPPECDRLPERDGVEGRAQAVGQGQRRRIEQEPVPAVRVAGLRELVEDPILTLRQSHLDQVQQVHGQVRVVVLAREDLEHQCVRGHGRDVTSVEPQCRLNRETR